MRVERIFAGLTTVVGVFALAVAPAADADWTYSCAEATAAVTPGIVPRGHVANCQRIDRNAVYLYTIGGRKLAVIRTPGCCITINKFY